MKSWKLYFRTQTSRIATAFACMSSILATSFPQPALAATNPPLPVIFVHGIASNTKTWNVMRNHLTSNAPELSGLRLQATDGASPQNCQYSWDWTVDSPKDWTPLANGIPGNSGKYFSIDFSLNDNLTFARQAYELKTVIDCVKYIVGAGNSKVILVAHSMGGLASRYYIQSMAYGGKVYSDDVDSLITIGTPHNGAFPNSSQLNALVSHASDLISAERVAPMLLKHQAWLNLVNDSPSIRSVNQATVPMANQTPPFTVAQHPLPSNIKYYSIRAKQRWPSLSSFVPVQSWTLSVVRSWEDGSGKGDGIVPFGSQSLLDSIPLAAKTGLQHSLYDVEIHPSPNGLALNTDCTAKGSDFIAHVCETKNNDVIGKVRGILAGTAQPFAIPITGMATSLSSDAIHINAGFDLNGYSKFDFGISVRSQQSIRDIYIKKDAINETRGSYSYLLGLLGQPAGQTIYWKAFVDVGLGKIYGDEKSFVVPSNASAAIPAPILISPVNNTLLAGAPMLSWTAVDSAERYIVYLSTSKANLPVDATNPICIQCTSFVVNGSTYTPVSQYILPGTQYFWAAQAADDTGRFGYISDVGSFSTKSVAPLPAPLQLSPTNGSPQPLGNWLNLSWGTVAGATSYRMLLSTNSSDLAILPTDSDCIGGCVEMTITDDPNVSLNTSQLSPGRTYYWAVKARSPGAPGLVSAPASFYMEQTQCSFSSSQSSLTMPPAGGTYYLNVSAQPGCTSVATSNQTFCSVPGSPTLTDSSGQSILPITLTTNGGALRNCLIGIGGATINISQASSAPTTSYAFALIQAVGGSATQIPSGTSFSAGSTLTLIATPAAGYIFSGWQESGVIVSTGTNWSFPINGNRTITPIFSSTQISGTGLINPNNSSDQKWRLLGNNINTNSWQLSGQTVGIQSGISYRIDCADTPYYLPAQYTFSFVAGSTFSCNYSPKSLQALSPKLSSRAQPRMASGSYNSLVRLDDGRVLIWGNSQFTDFPNYGIYTAQFLTTNLLVPLFLANTTDAIGVNISPGQNSGLYTTNQGLTWKRWANAGASSLRVPTIDPSLTGIAKMSGNIALTTSGSIFVVSQSGSNTPIASLGNIVDIAGSYGGTYDTTLALRDDGAVISLTDIGNSIGCSLHGISTNTNCAYANYLAPVALPEISRVISIAAGRNNAYAVRDDGTVWVWGAGSNTGGVTRDPNDYRPVQIPGITGAKQIVASATNSTGTVYVLTGSGAVYAWGANDLGQLGRGTTTAFEANPMQISGLTNIVELGQTDGKGLLALDGSGFVWTVGVAGSVGNGTSLATLSNPVRVSCPNGYSGNLNIFAFASNCISTSTNTLTIGDASSTLGKQVQVNGVPISLPFSQAFPANAAVTVEVVPDIGVGFSSYRGDLYDSRSRIRTLVMNRDWNINVQLFDCSTSPGTIPTVVNGTRLPAISVGASGGLQTVNVLGDPPSTLDECHWGYTSTDAWLKASADGIGAGSFSLDIDPNPANQSRVGSFKIGGVSGGSIQVTQDAAPSDSTPDSFYFTSLIGAAPGTSVQSPSVLVGGINTSASISVANGEYSVGCTGTFSLASATISGGQTVCVRHTSSITPAASVTTTLTIGGVSGTFTSTTMASAPSAPLSVTAVAGDASAIVSFVAPTNNGGSTISSFFVTATPGAQTAVGGQSPITVSGLTNGTNYAFVVTAKTFAGTTSTSPPSNTVTPMGTQAISGFVFSPMSLSVGGVTTVRAAGGLSGQAITFTSESPTVCSVAGATIAGLSVGVCTISANQAGNTTYSPAATARQSIQVAAATFAVNILTGWNLVGNSYSSPVDVRSSFDDSTNIESVWKWVRDPAGSGNGGTWAFFTPNVGTTITDHGAQYALSMGFIPLTSIDAGEGFWVSAISPTTILIPGGVAKKSTDFRALNTGWNLVTIGEISSPSQFNSDLSTTPNTPGVVPINMASLWIWDNLRKNWYFYAPSLEAQGGTALIDYIGTKKYLDFTTDGKVLGASVGIWVNRP